MSKILILLLLLPVDAWEPMCVYVHIYMGTQEGQMRASGPQELELRAAASCLVCVLETKY